MKCLTTLLVASLSFASIAIIAPAQAADNATSYSQMASKMADAYQQLKPLPAPASDLGLKSPEHAYKVQALYVKQLAPNLGGIAGYKAGLTGTVAQKKFGYNQAVTGVLFKKGLLQPGVVVSKKGHYRLFLEVELAFFIKESIRAPITNEQQLLAHVASVAPAIELPDVNVGELKRMTGLDIIASNVGSRTFIIGAPKKLQGLDLDKLEATLFYNGKEIIKGLGSACLGGQFKALLWTINNILKYSGPVEQGQVIITGSLTGLTPGKPGDYRITYGALGEIAFSVK